MLVYTTKITARLRYTLKVIFTSVLNHEVKCTTNIDEFIAHTGPKINYTKETIENALRIVPVELLFEKDIFEQKIHLFDCKGIPAFFKNQREKEIPFDLLISSILNSEQSKRDSTSNVMAKNFAEIAFTDYVKKLQEQHGSRRGYERMEKFNNVDGLNVNEVTFIQNRDSFYLASIGVKEFPYVQHRGGPKGFLKVLDSKRIGFIDFVGNKQYVSVGNMATNNNVSLIMIDYPSKTRLKIFAKAEVVELKDNLELYDLLQLEDYKFRPERMLIFHIEAYDWNCPQHIIPRYTINEINDAFLPQQEYIKSLEKEIKKLKEQV